MTHDNDTKSIKQWLQQNLIWVFGVLVTLANLYIAYLLQPVKSDISVLAARMTTIETMGSPTAQITFERVEAIGKSIDELKAGQIRIEAKLDRYIERGL